MHAGRCKLAAAGIELLLAGLLLGAAALGVMPQCLLCTLARFWLQQVCVCLGLASCDR